MMKSIKTAIQQERETYRVPRTVHDTIPIRRIWNDGIFLCGQKFTRTFRFTDINYKVAGYEDKERMFRSYAELLGSLDSGATAKLTIRNHRPHRMNLGDPVFMEMKPDGLDKYRREYNRMLADKAVGGSGVLQERYLTVSVVKRDIEEARGYFTRIEAGLSARFAALGSRCEALNAVDRLRILHNFYRAGEENDFRFDVADMAGKGHDFRDYICPDSMEKHSGYLKLGERYCRVLFLKDYASYIKDSFVAELTDLQRNMMLSIDIIPIPTDEAVREVETRLLGVETNITNWQRGKRTHIFIDEFHVMFENEFSAAFFTSAWRQFRKRNAYPTAITQNVEYLLDSVRASTMLSNSEFIVMLNQAASDRGKLAKLLNISKEQMGHITDSPAGCGLIKYGSALVPFVNRFPQGTELYQLMTTRPGEGSFSRGQV